MSAVISFFRPAQTSRGGWSQQELAEFYRVEAALVRAGLPVVGEQGLSDEAEPWFVFCRSDGDTIMHFARIDGRYVVASAALDSPMRGIDFRALINQIAQRHPELLPIPRSRDSSKLAVHPAALLAAIVAAAALALAPDDAIAGEVTHAGAGPAQADAHIGQPSAESDHGGPSEERDSYRKQYEAIVFSAMIFAATAFAADHAVSSTEGDPLASLQGFAGTMGQVQGEAIPGLAAERAERVAVSGPPSASGASGPMGSGAAVSTSADPGGAAVLQPSRTDSGSNGPGHPAPALEHLQMPLESEGQPHGRGTNADLSRTTGSSKSAESSPEASTGATASTHGSGQVGGSPSPTETTTSQSSSPGPAQSANEASPSQSASSRSASRLDTEATGTPLEKAGPAKDGGFDAYGTDALGSPKVPVSAVESELRGPSVIDASHPQQGQATPEIIRGAGSAHAGADGSNQHGEQEHDATASIGLKPDAKTVKLSPSENELNSASGPEISGLSEADGLGQHASSDRSVTAALEASHSDAKHANADDALTSPAIANEANNSGPVTGIGAATLPLEGGGEATAPAAEGLSEIGAKPRDADQTNSASAANHNAGDAGGLENSSAASHAPDDNGPVIELAWEPAISSQAALATGADSPTHADEALGVSGAQETIAADTASASRVETKPAEASHPQTANEPTDADHGNTAPANNSGHNTGLKLSTDPAESSLSVPTSADSTASASSVSDTQAAHATAQNQAKPLAASVDSAGNVVFSMVDQHAPSTAQKHLPDDGDVHADVGLVGVQDHGSGMHDLELHW